MPAPAVPRRPAAAVNAALAVLLVAGGIWAYQAVTGPGTSAAANTGYRTVPVLRGTVTASVTADGSVQSASTASAAFVTGGTVTAIDVRVGQLVRKGERLAQVDPAAANRNLAEADANLAAAQDALTRAQNAGSDTTTAENQVTQARLAVDDAQAAVDGTVLRAPMTGTVVAVNGTLGSASSGTGSSGSSGGGSSSGGASGGGSTGSAGGGSSTGAGATSSGSSGGFVDLADLTKLQVTANFAEADAIKLKVGQVATITWNALTGTVENGTVAAIDPQATTSNNVVTYGVTLSLGRTPAGAKSGQTVSVSVVTGEVRNAIYVNSAAVTTVGNRHTVTVESGGQQQVTPVEIGLKGDTATQILSGVQAGQQVVVAAASSTSGSGTGFPGAGRLGGFGGAGFGGGAGGAGRAGTGTGGTGTGGAGTGGAGTGGAGTGGGR